MRRYLYAVADGLEVIHTVECNDKGRSSEKRKGCCILAVHWTQIPIRVASLARHNCRRSSLTQSRDSRSVTRRSLNHEG